jgi:hypothetical protein
MRVAGVAFAGFAAILWLVWVWLGIPESSVWELLGSVALAMVILAGLGWLLACVLSGQLWSRSLWVLMSLLVIALFAAAGVSLWLAGLDAAAAEWLAMRISRTRGRAVNPRTLSWVFPALRWGGFAVLAFISIGPLATGGWRILRSWRYWLLAASLVLAGAYLPWKLITWVPAAKTLTTQAISVAVRFGLAYTLSVAALVAFGVLLRRLPAIRTATSP